jgi:nucleotidyltransferase/DNA polymerase involved in DNA repair
VILNLRKRLSKRFYAQLAGAVGPKLAAILAEACWGRDASAVTPRGPPKSLTVEDSFKTCKSYAEAKRVLQRLAPDLLERCACVEKHRFWLDFPDFYSSCAFLGNCSVVFHFV